MIQSPEDRKKIRNALQEVSNSYTRVEAERDLIKDIIKTISEDFDLPKKTVRKMAKVYHKQNFNQEREEFSDFEAMYEEVLGTPVDVPN